MKKLPFLLVILVVLLGCKKEEETAISANVFNAQVDGVDFIGAKAYGVYNDNRLVILGKDDEDNEVEIKFDQFHQLDTGIYSLDDNDHLLISYLPDSSYSLGPNIAGSGPSGHISISDFDRINDQISGSFTADDIYTDMGYIAINGLFDVELEQSTIIDVSNLSVNDESKNSFRTRLEKGHTDPSIYILINEESGSQYIHLVLPDDIQESTYNIGTLRTSPDKPFFRFNLDGFTNDDFEGELKISQHQRDKREIEGELMITNGSDEIKLFFQGFYY